MLALLTLAALAAAGACDDATPPPQPTAACGAVTHPEEQAGGHLVGDAEPPVPYSSTPGTSGWHSGGAPRTGVFGVDDALSEPQLILALEVGQVVAAYDPQELDAGDVARLEELGTGRHEGRLTVTPFEGDMGAALTLNAWTTQQRCDTLDADALDAFVEAFAGSGPGPA